MAALSNSSTVAWQHCCTAALLHSSTVAWQHCCTPALLHGSTVAQMHCCMAAKMNCSRVQKSLTFPRNTPSVAARVILSLANIESSWSSGYFEHIIT